MDRERWQKWADTAGENQTRRREHPPMSTWLRDGDRWSGPWRLSRERRAWFRKFEGPRSPREGWHYAIVPLDEPSVGR